MKDTKLSHRAIALFFTLTFLPSIFPANFIFANNNGPTAPEATSFEPVDASDMVNLATGDLSYVLPLLNVPSPEGGYPLALAYHSGIAIDQEASWVGLGWTLNPGAINRSVNGYPDDWKGARFKEYFYDQGESESVYSVSLGYTSFATGGGSVGLSLSWGDNRAFGGSVSAGVGLSGGSSVGGSLGTNGASLNAAIGLGQHSAYSIQGSIGTNGTGVGINYGFDRTTNGPKGVSVGVNSSWSGDVSANVSYAQGEKNKKNSVGIDLSSRGIGVTGKIGGVGTGANISFQSSLAQSDYTMINNGWFLPLYYPVGEGALSFSFGKQTVGYELNQLVDNIVSGPLYFTDFAQQNGIWSCSYFTGGDPFDPYNYQNHTVSSSSHIHSGTDYKVSFISTENALTDVYEVDVNNNSDKLKLDNNNAVFPNYDSYRVSAQGVAGSMKPTHFKTGALFGLSKEVEDSTSDFELEYTIPSENTLSQLTSFNPKTYFHFENEYSSSLSVNPVQFDVSTNALEIFDYLDESSISANMDRKYGGRFVEYFTNEELSSPSAFNSGILKATETIDYSDTNAFEADGIGAFKVTTADGKTYHYSLPVYNHELVARQYGMNPVNPGKNEAYFEKRQLKKYATHWLLTAVTGPDFIDHNGNRVADEGDYGYWVSMDYGKWSDGYVWYAPHGEEYNVDDENPDLKNYTWGRKDIYYLDQVKTRTHTALFVKEHRNDSQGKRLFHQDRIDTSNARMLDFKGQTLLRLKEIILLKNEDALSVNKLNISSIPSIPSANFSESMQWYDNPEDGGGTKQISYSSENNILDTKDVQNWNVVRDNAVKVVDFTGYSYELANGAPYTDGGVGGRLTLKHVTFKGKGAEQLIPSYNFEYSQGAYNLNHKDEWGYNRFKPEIWSLNEIQLPTGGKIQMEYEADTFTSAINHDLSWDSTEPDNNDYVYVNENANFVALGIQVNDMISVSHKKLISCTSATSPYNPNDTNEYSEATFDTYNGLARVANVSSNQLQLKLESSPVRSTNIYNSDCGYLQTYGDYNRVNYTEDYFSSGIRTKSITTTDGIDTYKTEYNYNKPGTNETSGIVSYIPFVSNQEEVPYGIELPPAVPMYGHVRTTAYGANDASLGYTDYEFKVLSPKDFNRVKFGDVIEINSDQQTFTNENDVDVDVREIEIVDNMASLGQLLSTATYNNYDQLLTKTINNYASGSEVTQGIAQESYQTYKKVDYTAANKRDKWVINTSTRTNYPSVLNSTTVVNGGFESTTYFAKYDSKSGQLLETVTEQSDGSLFKTETVPAYIKYPDLGSKIDNSSNKHMLTQTAMSKSYLEQAGNWVETGAAITTWQPETYSYVVDGSTNTENVWRKHKSYVWDGQTNEEGLYVGFDTNTDDGFNWSLNASSQPSNWKFLSEISTYDTYSMPLEVMDINENFASTKMGDDNTKVIATGNGSLAEIYYSGAEYLSGSNFDDGIYGVGQSNEKAHTGNYSIKINTQQGFRTTVSGYRPGKYKISVWASKDHYLNARVNDGTGLKLFNGETFISGDWVLLNHYVDFTSGAKTVYVNSASGDVYFDDFRIHPVSSSMVSYVYDKWDELIAMLDGNNLATKYEYDAIGRLISTKTEVEDGINFVGGFKKIAYNRYQYNQPIEGSTGNIEPLFASVTYGTSSSNYQDFVARVTGGSGNYTFRWYKGIGDSSTQFETSWSGASSTFRWNNLSGCNTRYVRLVVTDDQYGYLGESIRVIRNANECDSTGGGENEE